MLLANAAVTPAGKPVADPIPVANVVVWVMFVKAVLIHNVGVDEAVPAVFVELTVPVIAELIVVAPVLAEVIFPDKAPVAAEVVLI